MKLFLRHYPISLLLAIVIIYLSCFKPPQNSLENIPNIDKLVHFSMYCCLSLLLWLEYLRTHHFSKKDLSWHGWILGLAFPVLLGFCMELVQKYMTSYRAFEWGDVAANTSGAIFASICFCLFIKIKLK